MTHRELQTMSHEEKHGVLEKKYAEGGNVNTALKYRVLRRIKEVTGERVKNINKPL